MFIDINKIQESAQEIDVELTLEPAGAGREEPARIREARFVGTVERGERGVQLEARLAVVLELPCGRCIESYESRLEIPVFLILTAKEIEHAVGETRIDAADTNLFHAPEGKADLVEIAREQIYLNLPLKPVCTPDCRGLCPTCGGNRNRIECDCRSEALDPRLAPLEELRKRMGDT